MKLWRHTKNYYLGKIQDGVLEKEKVAEIFGTSINNVEEALVEYEKRKNPFKKRNFEKNNALLQIFISIVSTLLVLFTLFEMQVARNAAYMPDIVLGKMELAVAWDKNGMKINKIDDVSNIALSVLKEDALNENPKAKVYNLGVGTAKDIVIRWDNKKNLQQFSDIFENCEDISLQIYQNGMVSVTNPYGVYGTSIEEEQNEFEFMLSSAQEYNTIRLPWIYAELYREVLRRLPHTSLPTLYLEISYSDIQGKSYSKQVSLHTKLLSYMEDMEGNGCGECEIISIEEKSGMASEMFGGISYVAEWILNVFKMLFSILIVLLTIWLITCVGKRMAEKWKQGKRNQEKKKNRKNNKCSEDI